MEIQDVITQLRDKFGDKLDISAITGKLQGLDLKNLNFDDILGKLHADGLLGDLDGDGVQEGFFDELKGKASEMLSGIFHK